ncbi:hypothetical protein PybrP1_005525 [[Pythium] brassicae (nom. inval.)]|nr:hypothetical protein PybrP1_005525 [[Pythium] brassicae (nom. inval.)]
MVETNDGEKVYHITIFILHGLQFGYVSGHPVRGTTLSEMVHGVSHFFAVANTPFPSDNTQVGMLLKGNSRLYAPPAYEALVSIEMLEICFRSLQLSHPANQALWGVLCLGFFFLLQRSEIEATISTTFMRKISSLRLDKKADKRSMAGSHSDDPPLGVKGKRTRHSGHARSYEIRSPIHLAGDRRHHPAPSSSGSAEVFPRCSPFPAVGRRHAPVSSRCRPLTIQLHLRRASNAHKLYASISEKTVTLLSAKMACEPRRDTTLQRGA